MTASFIVSPGAGNAAAIEATSGDAEVLRRLQGRWSVLMPNMRQQELAIAGDRITRTVLPEEGVAGQKAEVERGRLSVLGPNQFRMTRAAPEEPLDFHLWWDRDGGLHLHILASFRPVEIPDRNTFDIVDEGRSMKVAYRRGACRYSDWEIETPRPVRCGFSPVDRMSGVVSLGGISEVFSFAVPGHESETDAYLKNEIYYVDGPLLVPATLAMSDAIRAEPAPRDDAMNDR